MGADTVLVLAVSLLVGIAWTLLGLGVSEAMSEERCHRRENAEDTIDRLYPGFMATYKRFARYPWWRRLWNVGRRWLRRWMAGW